MSLSTRIFSEAFRDMQRAMSALEHPALNSVAPLIGNRVGGALRYPAADLKETPNAYELHADLPGFDKNNIKIEMPDSQTLILSGSTTENKDATEKKESNNESQVTTKDNSNQVGEYRPHFWLKERVSSAFSRSFRFPSPVNPENIKASFKDGTLKVLVPKSSEEQPKQISIE
ncbi:HSP20-like chaperone [Thamnidium elegans]|nr:HSP20-like chaperone [Thamnidium elegans]